MTDSRIEAAAAAIANARGARRGAPAVANVLDVLKASDRLRRLYDEVIEDATAAIAAADAAREKPYVVIAPANHLPRIESLWAYVSRDAAGNEGLCAASSPAGFLMPLIAADQARLASLTPIAEKLAGPVHVIVLVEFTGRVDLRTITGPGQ